MRNLFIPVISFFVAATFCSSPAFAATMSKAAATSTSSTASAQAPAPLISTAPVTGRQTLEISVDGLNCALCSEAMRTSLKKITGARDIEPRLECGRIYLDVDPKAVLNEAGLGFALTANGFNLKGVRPVPQTLSQVRAVKESC